MFKEEIFTLWEDDVKAIDMADHATPPAHLEGDWDEWEWNDWEIFDGEKPEAWITVHADGHLEMPVDGEDELSWEEVRTASTLNPEDIPIFDKFFEDFELGDWRAIKFDELRVETW